MINALKNTIAVLGFIGCVSPLLAQVPALGLLGVKTAQKVTAEAGQAKPGPSGTKAGDAPAGPVRWKLVSLGKSLCNGGFDPARDWFDFVNSLNVVTRVDRNGEELDQWTADPMGICWGLSVVTHIYYRNRATIRQIGATAVESLSALAPSLRPFVEYFYDAAAPKNGERLADYCATSLGRRRVGAAVSAAVQTNSGYGVDRVHVGNAAALVVAVATQIRKAGTCVLSFWWADPSHGNARTQLGHAVLAYSIRFGKACPLGSTDSRDVVVIRFRDPNHRYTAESDGQTTVNLVDALIFDPRAGTLTFTADYLRGHNGSDTPSGTSFLQPREFLHIEESFTATEIHPEVISPQREAHIIANAIRIAKSKRTDVDRQPFTGRPR